MYDVNICTLCYGTTYPLQKNLPALLTDKILLVFVFMLPWLPEVFLAHFRCWPKGFMLDGHRG